MSIITNFQSRNIIKPEQKKKEFQMGSHQNFFRVNKILLKLLKSTAKYEFVFAHNSNTSGKYWQVDCEAVN